MVGVGLIVHANTSEFHLFVKKREYNRAVFTSSTLFFSC
ncbi:hypothetical protein GAGA_1827 [Paraglaciecola agarilytica NO2]|uniref:Uncharacterized protein n=1 Tax=Paraglaciecola agarilytica NO2 TaxID=1125747 RepID=A0ABQ0I5Y2_9ALTE|nr:hypothetical protein GAGA_1827 [Paraglaciecola agarilytica NO2]